MGFWHTGYLDHMDAYVGDIFAPTREVVVPPPVFPCPLCHRKFDQADLLDDHLFDGHRSNRPILMLHGRECGRSRIAVVSETAPADWVFHNCHEILVNGSRVPLVDAASRMASTAAGVFEVRLIGERTEQQFEFSFEIADPAELEAVDQKLDDIVMGRSLSIGVIEAFLDVTARFRTVGSYSAAIGNYLFGVLGREQSPESGLVNVDDEGRPRYMSRFDDAVETLRHVRRPPAEAICGLVAFQYNHFAEAQMRTASPRVAQVAGRLGALFDGNEPSGLAPPRDDRSSMDYTLSDAVTEAVLEWSCVPLDGSAATAVREMESAIDELMPADQLKLHVVAAEHHLAAGAEGAAEPHLRAVRHNHAAEAWVASFRNRMEQAS